MNGRSGLLALAGLGWSGLVMALSQRGEPPVGVTALLLMAVWLAVFWLAAWGGGFLVWRALLRRSPRGVDETLIAMIVGAGALGGVAATLGVVGALRPWPLQVALGAFAVVGAVTIARGPRVPRTAMRLPAAALLPAAVIFVSWSWNLLSVTADSAFYDQLHYHLAFPSHWLREGRLLTFPRHDFSFYPAGMGLLYVYALSALGPWAAQAIHWSMGAFAVLAAARVAWRLGGPTAAWWTGAILSATPVLMWLSSVAGADLGVAAYGASGLLALVLGIEATERDRAAWWLVAGALAGLAASAKLLAVLLVGAPLFLVLLLAHGSWPLRLQRLLAWSSGAAVVLAPWLVRNLRVTGNPVYPFLPTLFAHGADVADAVERARAQGALRFMADPVRVVTLGALGPQDGSVGALHLLFLPFAVWCGLRARGLGRWLLAGSALGVLGWAAGPPTARYLLPVLVPLTALAGAGFARMLENLSARARIPLLAAAATACAWSMLLGVDRENLARTGSALGRDVHDAALTRWASYWPAVRVVNELPAGSRVLLVGESRTLYFERETLFDDPYRRPLLSELAEQVPTAAELAAELRRRGVTHVLINGFEARRLATLNGRADYLGELSPGARARIEGLRREHLHPVWSEGSLELMAAGVIATRERPRP